MGAADLPWHFEEAGRPVSASSAHFSGVHGDRGTTLHLV